VATDVRFADIASGEILTAAIDLEGGLWVWGWLHGEDGAEQWYEVPTPAGTAIDLATVVVGLGHLCVLDATGLASSWGNDAVGQLGTGGVTSSEGPVPVDTEVRFQRLAAGAMHTCGLDLGGAAWCWGFNQGGQLGDGTSENRDRPVPVLGGRTFVDIAAGTYVTCGLDAEGALWCWGANSSGQLGTGALDAGSPTPVPVRSEVPFVRLAAGEAHVCAVDADGHVWCWGGTLQPPVGSALMPGFAVLGRDTEAHTFLPRLIDSDLRFTEVRTRAASTCARAESGDWYCWGKNRNGQLGIDDQVRSPARVRGPERP
jgi:alpha-tubulin suppressor-like RCC1 family protein